MNAHWSGEQQRVLAALGYLLYQPIVVRVADVINTPTVDANAALVAAMLRAAGVDAAGIGDIDAWWRAQALPSVAQLRVEPSCKRAIWPRLRALRKGAS
ncbi:MAG: hypothetical protein JSR34_10385 [Proteobacteria bacterium]|nr:hypothetical protein [Pseudomonadota bacterium]